MNNSNPDVSVVIATLGGGQLSKTIAAINAGSMAPSEVLICIPEQYSPRVSEIHDVNVRVICTSFMGQVAQRAEGLRQAKEPLVMQLDDDILPASDAVEVMARCLIALGRGHVVGPVIYSSVTDKPLTRMDATVRGFLNSMYESIVRGLPWGLGRMGALSDIGGCGGVDPRYCEGELFPTAWLPGGCSISFREDLILNNFFPYTGKAYSEDILHSYLRSCRRIRHYVATFARVTIDPPELSVTRESMIAEIRARRYVAKELGGRAIRATIAAVLDIVRRQIALLLLR